MGMTLFDKAIRVASYNMRKGIGLDRRRDPARILRVINGIDAQVVALQEADRRLGDRPAVLCRKTIERETDFQVLPIARNGVSLGWHGNAVLAHKDLRFGDITHLDLPGLEPRGAVVVDFEDFSLVATHLGLLRRHRQPQLNAIARAVADRERVIVAGDFNEWSQRKGLEPLAHFAVHSPGHSFHAARPVAALDRFALSRDLRPRAMGVVKQGVARIASDHLPIWVDLETAA